MCYSYGTRKAACICCLNVIRLSMSNEVKINVVQILRIFINLLSNWQYSRELQIFLSDIHESTKTAC